MLAVVARPFGDVIQAEIEGFMFVFRVFTTQFPDVSPMQEVENNDRAYERNTAWSLKVNFFFRIWIACENGKKRGMDKKRTPQLAQ